MTSVYQARCHKAQRQMQAAGVDALLVGASADLRYLSGYAAHSSERLTCFVLPAQGEPCLVIPAFEAPRLGEAPWFAVHTWTETENPTALVAQALGGVTGHSLAVGDRTWAGFLLRLQEALPGNQWLSATPLLRELRMVKSAEEVAALREAGAAVDAVFQEMLARPWAGRAEREVGEEMAALMRRGGCEAVDFVIVASGPNGASPHHANRDRLLQPGDAVVLDFGGPFRDGYYADITRTVVVGPPSAQLRQVYAVVQAAQEAGVRAVRPGVPCQEVDAAARQIIVQAGYGDYFTHRTGHGIGLDGHEEPYMVAGNTLPLAPGMTFSVEPGIYLPGQLGVRIEDIVVCTETGAERLNQASRELIEVR
jgi:Xaa-Pro aminopeptidase